MCRNRHCRSGRHCRRRHQLRCPYCCRPACHRNRSRAGSRCSFRCRRQHHRSCFWSSADPRLRRSRHWHSWQYRSRCRRRACRRRRRLGGRCPHRHRSRRRAVDVAGRLVTAGIAEGREEELARAKRPSICKTPVLSAHEALAWNRSVLRTFDLQGQGDFDENFFIDERFFVGAGCYPRSCKCGGRESRLSAIFEKTRRFMVCECPNHDRIR